MTSVSKRARSSASTSRRSLSPRRDYPRGTSTVTRPSQASPEQAESRPVHAQHLEIFKADMTSMVADMLESSLLPPSLSLTLGARESLFLCRMWLQIKRRNPQIMVIVQRGQIPLLMRIPLIFRVILS